MSSGVSSASSAAAGSGPLCRPLKLGPTGIKTVAILGLLVAASIPVLLIKGCVASSDALAKQPSVQQSSAQQYGVPTVRVGTQRFKVKVQSDLSRAEVIPCPSGHEVIFDTLDQTYLTQFTFHIEEAKVKELRFKYEGGGFWSCNGKPYQGRYNLDVFTRSTTLRVTTEGSVVEEMFFRIKPFSGL